MSAFGLSSFPTSSSQLQRQKTLHFPSTTSLAGFPRVSSELCHWKTKAVVHRCCMLSPSSKESSLRLQRAELDGVEILSIDFERPYMVSFGNYMVREAVLDEEYWAAAWLRAKIHSEGQPYFRYIESYQKRLAEQEFTALKRRCLGRQGQCLKCVCLVAVASERPENDPGMTPKHTLRDRVMGTLDISVRHLQRGERFPKEVVTASLFTVMEPERRCGYIANVCVASTARRQGIASSLLEVAIKAAKSWKLKDLYVHVASDNMAARRLYRKVGFQVVEDAACVLSQQQLLCMCI